MSEVSELEGPQQGFDIQRHVVKPVLGRWKMVVAIPALLTLLVLLWQALSTPVYTARTVVTATGEQDALGSQLGKLGGIAAIAGASLGPGGNSSEFDKFQFMLTSVRLGDYHVTERNMLPIVFSRQWDPQTKSWIRPDGPVQAVKDVLWPVFGLPAWLPPDGRKLADHYDRNLQIRERGTTGLLQLSYEDRDPDRAIAVLQAMVQDANELLRRDAARQAAAKADYLRLKLAEAQIAEYRVNLAGLLATEEQTLMLTSTSLPYAAETIQPYTVSSTPTSQRPIIYGAIAFILGASLSLFLALVMGAPRTETASV